MLKKKLSSDGTKLLLGVDKDGTQYWLKKHKWECGWYWSFGHIHYGGSFSHFDSLFGKDEKGNACNLYDGFKARITESPLYQPGESEIDHKLLWQLCDLFKTAYTLKDAAEILGRGGSNYTSESVLREVIQDETYTKHLNDAVIPNVLSMAEFFLEPEKEKK